MSKVTTYNTGFEEILLQLYKITNNFDKFLIKNEKKLSIFFKPLYNESKASSLQNFKWYQWTFNSSLPLDW